MAVYNNRNMYFYADGKLIGTSYFNSTIFGYSNTLYIGAIGNYPFNGTIDEVRIYNTALTAAEIQKHYAEGARAHGIVLK